MLASQLSAPLASTRLHLFLSFSQAQAGVANHISDTVREVAPGRDHFIYELLATNRLRNEVMFPAGANNYSHNQQVIPFRARIRQLVLCWQSSAVDNSEEGGQETQATCHGVSYSSRKPRMSRIAPSYSGTSPTTAAIPAAVSTGSTLAFPIVFANTRKCSFATRALHLSDCRGRRTPIHGAILRPEMRTCACQDFQQQQMIGSWSE